MDRIKQAIEMIDTVTSSMDGQRERDKQERREEERTDIDQAYIDAGVCESDFC